jgi:hypothetical protein
MKERLLKLILIGLQAGTIQWFGICILPMVVVYFFAWLSILWRPLEDLALFLGFIIGLLSIFMLPYSNYTRVIIVTMYIPLAPFLIGTVYLAAICSHFDRCL